MKTWPFPFQLKNDVFVSLNLKGFYFKSKSHRGDLMVIMLPKFVSSDLESKCTKSPRWDLESSRWDLGVNERSSPPGGT